MNADNGSNVTWANTVFRRHTPLMLSFAVAGQAQERIEKVTGITVGFRHQRRRGLGYQFATEEMNDARALIHGIVSARGLGFFEEFADRCEASCKRLAEAASLAQRDPKEGSRDTRDIAARLTPYFEASVDQGALLLTVILVQFELEAFLEETVARAAPDAEKRNDVIDALKVPLTPTNEVQSFAALLALAAKVQSIIPQSAAWPSADTAELTVRIAQDHADVWNDIEDYIQQFGWMGRMYFAGSNVAPVDVVVRLQNKLREDCGAAIREIENRKRYQLESRETAIEVLGQKLGTRLANVVSRFLFLRSERLDAFFISYGKVCDVLEHAAGALGLTPPKVILWLGWQEISAALRNGQLDPGLVAAAAERMRLGFEFESLDGMIEWNAISPSADAGATTSQGSADELYGVTACGGTIEGKVRLLQSDADMLAMEKGEILVTTMTVPGLMLAVEKASAIVTDEGGMLCHAAIVSREFNIPCVIGTGSATHQLRTGDVVEVRADDGLVRLLHRRT